MPGQRRREAGAEPAARGSTPRPQRRVVTSASRLSGRTHTPAPHADRGARAEPAAVQAAVLLSGPRLAPGTSRGVAPGPRSALVTTDAHASIRREPEGPAQSQHPPPVRAVPAVPRPAYGSAPRPRLRAGQDGRTPVPAARTREARAEPAATASSAPCPSHQAGHAACAPHPASRPAHVSAPRHRPRAPSPAPRPEPGCAPVAAGAHACAPRERGAAAQTGDGVPTEPTPPAAPNRRPASVVTRPPDGPSGSRRPSRRGSSSAVAAGPRPRPCPGTSRPLRRPPSRPVDAVGQRSAAPHRSAATATAASRATFASSLVSVRSGARKRSVNVSDRRPPPTCSPV